jgi:hypothetical protein
MESKILTPNDLSKAQKVKLVIDFWHRTMMHHAIWYGEVMHQFGREKALNVLKVAFNNAYQIHMKRLSDVLGFEIDENVPKPLLDLPDEKIEELRSKVAVNWLATDGVWFQAVEFSRGMNDAKRCNDNAWAQFSPFEAWSIKEFLGLSENPGLDGLKSALNFRLYATVNKQSIEVENEKSFIFRMNECRVQSARKRKGLDDYPCKSGGLVEYSTFAEAIDPRIKTECIGCPPDKHPEEWYCSWRFSVE